jgi:hypothetical protein
VLVQAPCSADAQFRKSGAGSSACRDWEPRTALRLHKRQLAVLMRCGKHLLRHFYTKYDPSPRQARDQRRENSRRDAFFAGGFSCSSLVRKQSFVEVCCPGKMDHFPRQAWDRHQDNSKTCSPFSQAVGWSFRRARSIRSSAKRLSARHCRAVLGVCRSNPPAARMQQVRQHGSTFLTENRSSNKTHSRQEKNEPDKRGVFPAQMAIH